MFSASTPSGGTGAPGGTTRPPDGLSRGRCPLAREEDVVNAREKIAGFRGSPRASARGLEHAKPRNPVAALAGPLASTEVAAETDVASRASSAIARVQDRADAPGADPRDAPHARTASSAARRRPRRADGRGPRHHDDARGELGAIEDVVCIDEKG